MKRRIACAVIGTLAAVFVGCGGGGSSGPSSPGPQSPITRGLLVITQTSDGLYGPTPNGMWRITLPVEVRAMNEIPLTLNYARLTLFDAVGAETLRVEVPTSDIIAQAGTNQVTRERALAFRLVFEYVPQPAANATLLLNARDANGNTLESSLLNMRWVPDPSLPQ